MNAVPDAWRHDDALGWFPHAPGIDDEHLPPELPSGVAPRVTNALGIDISSFQGTSINWQQVAASGRAFCMIKSTEGTTYISPALDAQYHGATAAGVLCGLYHYGTPSASSSPEAEADAFAVQVNRLGAIAGHMPPCLDLETGTGDLSGWAQRFITRLRAQTGCVRVLIYSGAAFMQNQIYGNGSWLDANVALWVAAWSDPPGSPSFAPKQLALHQYSSSGSVAGISGAVDLDWAVWPLSTLVPGATPPPAVTPPPVNPADLTSDQAAQLTACYQQLSGSPAVGQWPGWPSWPGGSGRSLTLVDFARQADVLLNALVGKVNALSAAATSAPAGALSDADVQRIATAVTAMLAQRMAS